MLTLHVCMTGRSTSPHDTVRPFTANLPLQPLATHMRETSLPPSRQPKRQTPPGLAQDAVPVRSIIVIVQRPVNAAGAVVVGLMGVQLCSARKAAGRSAEDLRRTSPDLRRTCAPWPSGVPHVWLVHNGP